MGDCIRWVLGSLMLATLSGCAQLPYRHGAVDQYVVSPRLAPLTEPQMEVGSRRPVIDTIGWIIGIPSKIVLWDRRIDNHSVSAPTIDAVGQFVAVNELDTVKVRVNQYAPIEDWDRLVANESVGWGWRYTAGTLCWLGETIFPGRIWGGDHFNPFTNTIHLYSDVPAIAIHEAGHAKDFARRTWKGTYAAIYFLPVVPLWHEALATNDALGYLHEHGTPEAVEEGYQILYPAYGTYVGNAASTFLPWNSWLVYAGAVIPAHVLGRFKAQQVVVEQFRPDDPMSSVQPRTESSAAVPEANLSRVPLSSGRTDALPFGARLNEAAFDPFALH
jgi:hypothetical protein